MGHDCLDWSLIIDWLSNKHHLFCYCEQRIDSGPSVWRHKTIKLELAQKRAVHVLENSLVLSQRHCCVCEVSLSVVRNVNGVSLSVCVRVCLCVAFHHTTGLNTCYMNTRANYPLQKNLIFFCTQSHDWFLCPNKRPMILLKALPSIELFE